MMCMLFYGILSFLVMSIGNIVFMFWLILGFWVMILIRLFGRM